MQHQLDLATMYGLMQPDDATDTMPSPVSPTLPLENTYQLPQGSEWLSTKAPHSPALVDFAIPTRYSESASPVVNPLELALGSFDGESLEVSQTPMFDEIVGSQYAPPAKSRKTSASTAAPARNYYDATSPPSTSDEAARYPSRKRKSLASATDSAASSPASLSPPSPAITSRRSPSSPASGPKKTAHNMIEKRYRNNLNDKITALRDAVPSLRVAAYRLEQGLSPDEPAGDLDDGMLADELGGLAPAQKLNKATILSKAAEYILHLERRNKRLAEENAALKSGAEWS